MTNDFLKKNRRTILGVVLIPVMAVVVALALIALLRPTKTLPIAIAVGAVLAQYLFLVSQIWKRLNTSKPPDAEDMG